MLSRQRDDDRAATMVEFTITILFLLLLIAVVIDVSIYCSAKNIMAIAAQEGLATAAKINGLENPDRNSQEYQSAIAGIQQRTMEVINASFISSTSSASYAYLTNVNGGAPFELVIPSSSSPTISPDQALRETPITLTLRAVVRPFFGRLSFLPDFPIVVTNAGFREPRKQPTLPLETDCNGVPQGSSNYNAHGCPCSGANTVYSSSTNTCACKAGFIDPENDGSCSCAAGLTESNGSCICTNTCEHGRKPDPKNGCQCKCPPYSIDHPDGTCGCKALHYSEQGSPETIFNETTGQCECNFAALAARCGSIQNAWTYWYGCECSCNEGGYNETTGTCPCPGPYYQQNGSSCDCRPDLSSFCAGMNSEVWPGLCSCRCLCPSGAYDPNPLDGCSCPCSNPSYVVKGNQCVSTDCYNSATGVYAPGCSHDASGACSCAG